MQGQGQMMQVSKHHDASDDVDYAYANANAYAGQETFDVGVQEIQDRRLIHMCYVKVSKFTTFAKFRILGPDDGRSWHAGDGEARSVRNSLSSFYFTNTFSSLSLSLSQRQRQSLSTTSLCAATTPPLHNFGLNFQCVGLVLSFLSPLALVFCWSGSKRSRT